jgi:hypothetical protein
MKKFKFPKNKISLAFIAPVNHVNEISSLGDIDYCLAPYVKKHASYFNYFKNRIENKGYVIIDDTIAENGGTLDMADLVKIAIQLQVSEIVIPDVIGDYEKSKKMREKFLDVFYNDLKKNKIKIMGVIQGKNLFEYLQALEEIEDDDRINVVGIPFRIKFASFNDMTKDSENMYNRICFIRMFTISKPVHLLGCNLAEELVLLKDNTTSNIRSCDSKLMTRYGKAEQIFEYNHTSKPSVKLNMDESLNKYQVEYAIKNIEKLKNG